ncbi:MAG: ABC transporter permease [Chloroflexota bacterium]|nr:ABC transporter permease [Chloroflexota bacterium]
MVEKKARSIRQRFYFELVLGAASSALFLVTLIWKDWIEIAFRIDPDSGSGAVEYGVCCVLLAVAVGSWWLARTEWRHFRLDTTYA